MVRFAFTLLGALFFVPAVFAQQESPKVQLFGGFSLFHADQAGLNGAVVGYALDQPPSLFQMRSFYTGWEAQGQYNATKWVGIAIDFGGRSGQPFEAPSSVTGIPTLSSYSILAGPVISYRTKSTFTPYVHTLFGWERTSLSASTINGPLGSITGAGTTYNDFVLALGAGLDCKLNHRFALRLAQVDWYHTSINENLFYGSAYGPDRFLRLGNHEDNIRISTGVVVKF
jgi:opacity protein-like surface antigen